MRKHPDKYKTPKKFFRDIKVSPAYLYKVRVGLEKPSTLTALKIYRALSGQVDFLDILNDEKLNEVAVIICKELQKRKKEIKGE
jgi:hypothetical protein